MRKRGFFTRSTGDLTIIIPSYDDELRPAGMSDEEYFEFARDNMLAAMGMPNDTAVGEFDELDAPTDRTFRNAWEVSDNVIEVNMDKAKVIHMDVIRVERNKELAAKDITFMRAVEAGDASAQSAIGTEKQVLRDLPATFDLTTGVDTPEKLKVKWPTELPDRE